MYFTTKQWATLAALVLSSLAAETSFADEKWVPKASGGVYVRGVRTFPNTPAPGTSTSFAFTLNSGVWKFTDSSTGPTTPSQTNFGLPSLRVRVLTAATINALYAATDAFGIYKSTNQGATWTAANGSGGTALPCREARTANALTDSTILVGTGCDYSSGIFKSIDGGTTWSKLGGATVPDDVEIFSITPADGGATLILSTARHGILRSIDSGATFAAINGNIPTPDGAGNLRVASVAVGATSAEMLAAVTGQGMLRTTNSGVTWTAVNTGLPAGEVLAGVSRESATVFYIGIDGQGPYRSVDGGLTWSLWSPQDAESDRRFTRSVTPDATSPGRYYLAAIGTLFRTNNSGAQWIDMSLGEGYINSFAMAPDNKTTYIAGPSVYKIPDLYLGDFDGGITADTGLPGNTIDGFVFLDRFTPSNVYVTVPNYGLYKTTNAGGNWSKLANFVKPTAANIAFVLDHQNTQTMYGGFGNPFRLAGGGGIFKSIDGGANWTPSSTGLATPAARSVNMLRASYLTAGTVFAATDAGIYRSTDSGANWALVYSVNDGNGQPMPIRSVEADRANPNLFYAMTDHANPDGTLRASSGILRSTNGGSNWSVVLPNVRGRQVRTQTFGQAIAILDRTTPGQPGVLRSSDAGTTWVPFSKGILDNDMSAPALLSDGSRVVAVSSRQGIYGLTVDKDTAGDGRGDLFWREPGPAVGLSWWSMLGNAVTASNYHQVDSAWQIADVGDLDGDGRADLVWRRNSDGANYLWTLNGQGFKGFFDLGVLSPAQWSLAGTADFDGDGMSDIVWRGTDGTVYMWFMNGGTIVSQGVAGNPGTAWVISDMADMDGDGKADLVFRNTTTGAVFIWFMNGLTVTSGASAGTLDNTWTLQGAGDFNGDGKADLLWRHSSGDTWIWLMNGGTFLSGASIGNPGAGWSVKALTDLDGDGKVDLVWRHTDGTTYFWKMNGTTVSNYLPISNPGGTWQIVAP